MAITKYHCSYTSWSRLVAWLTSAAALFKLVCAFLLLSCKSDLFGFSVRQKAKSGSHPAASCLLLAKQAAAPSSQQQLLWPTLSLSLYSRSLAAFLWNCRSNERRASAAAPSFSLFLRRQKLFSAEADLRLSRWLLRIFLANFALVFCPSLSSLFRGRACFYFFFCSESLFSGS